MSETYIYFEGCGYESDPFEAAEAHVNLRGSYWGGA